MFHNFFHFELGRVRQPWIHWQVLHTSYFSMSRDRGSLTHVAMPGAVLVHTDLVFVRQSDRDVVQAVE